MAARFPLFFGGDRLHAKQAPKRLTGANGHVRLRFGLDDLPGGKDRITHIAAPIGATARVPKTVSANKYRTRGPAALNSQREVSMSARISAATSVRGGTTDIVGCGRVDL